MMWYMNEERELIKNIARDFTAQEVKPIIMDLENNHKYPRHLIKRMGELGFMGIIFPEDIGGTGPDWTTFGVVLEEIAKESNLVAILLMLNASICAYTVHELGTKEQSERWVRPAINGDVNLALAVTEPVGAFNWTEHQTTAVLDGDSWIVNGGKVFCTNAGNADCYITGCITSKPDLATYNGLSYVLVPATTPGFEVGHIENKVGWPGSSTGQVYFKNCRVPKENLLGPKDVVFPLLYAGLIPEFVSFGACCLGSAVGVYEKTLKYTKERIQRGSSLFDSNQIIRHRLAKMFVDIECFRGGLYGTLAMMDQGLEYTQQAMALKIKGAELFEKVASEAILLFGANGTVLENGIERYYRDAKMTAIAGGSVDFLVDGLSMTL